jgi:hypothetical protein
MCAKRILLIIMQTKTEMTSVHCQIFTQHKLSLYWIKQINSVDHHHELYSIPINIRLYCSYSYHYQRQESNVQEDTYIPVHIVRYNSTLPCPIEKGRT